MIKKTIDFIYHGIWQIDTTGMPAHKRLLYSIVRKLLLAIGFFTTRRVTQMASALTYSTLLAIVPILAVVFAIARGFGYNKYIEDWFRDALSSQPQVADVLVGFVNSYLVHTKSGIILGLGLVFMLWTVTMLTNNIEQIFNGIWQIKKPRTVYRIITDYFAMMFLVPIIIVLYSGVNIFMGTVMKSLHGYILLGPLVRFLINLAPYVLTSLVFVLMYICIPNTKVKFRFAIVPGILAGIAMQWLQYFYIHSQLWVSSYNAIYGSFAALPLFMLWIQLSWTICLFGAQLCYTSQHLEQYAFLASSEKLSHRYRIMLCCQIMAHICQRYEDGERPLTAMQIKQLTQLPIRVTTELLNQMIEAQLIIENSRDYKGEDCTFVPAEANMTVGKVMKHLEAQGSWTPDMYIKLRENESWKEVFRQRNLFLQQMEDIRITDLIKN